jgi:hypothetical protein
MSDDGGAVPGSNPAPPAAYDQPGMPTDAGRAAEFTRLKGKLTPFELICAAALAVAMVSFITGVVWALVT